jgi:hypothetical protein
MTGNVVRAEEPGIGTFLDLPLITGRGVQISRGNPIDSTKEDQQ